jgi:hypothetical protein
MHAPRLIFTVGRNLARNVGRYFSLARSMLPVLALVPTLLIVGCTQAKRDQPIAVAPAEYPAAFEAAKRVLLDFRFELDRVDYRAGIITTRRKDTSGLATPWDAEQTSFNDEVSDLLNRQARLIEITFVPASALEPSGSVAESTSPLTVRIDVTKLRERWPGRRIEPKAVRFSTFTRDTDLASRGLWPRFQAPYEGDEPLAQRFEARLAEQLIPAK